VEHLQQQRNRKQPPQQSGSVARQTQRIGNSGGSETSKWRKCGGEMKGEENGVKMAAAKMRERKMKKTSAAKKYEESGENQ
jgi:hypothetical protein